jgi:peptide/nickel transport system permease protein
MAADDSTPTRFEDIDWNDVEPSSRLDVSGKALGMLVSTLFLAALFLYDYFVVPKNNDTFEAIEWAYQVTQLDYLFGLTLLLIFFFVIVPIFQNSHLSRYYWNRFKQNRPALLSLGFLIATFTIGVFGPLVLARPELDLFAKYQPPVYTSVPESAVIECAGRVSDGMCHGTWQYPFGTTGGGKNILNIVVYGMQVSMKIGLMSAFIVTVIGSVVGTVAAYSGGLVDEVLFRYVDIQQTFPSFLLFLLLTYQLGSSLLLFIGIFGFFSWGNTARYVRSNALQKTEEEYIKSAKATGGSTWLIIRRHLIPNTASSIITDLSLLIPSFILFEAAFAFLGFGADVPSWGRTIASGRADLAFAWWISTIPGVFLFLTILAFNYLGDALLDALNPQADTESEA